MARSISQIRIELHSRVELADRHNTRRTDEKLRCDTGIVLSEAASVSS